MFNKNEQAVAHDAITPLNKWHACLTIFSKIPGGKAFDVFI
jgi:hypothetical protein